MNRRSQPLDHHVFVVVWLVDGEPLPEGRWRVIGSGNLQLSSIVANDTALYVCTLQEASISAAASLTVYGKYLLRSVDFDCFDFG